MKENHSSFFELKTSGSMKSSQKNDKAYFFIFLLDKKYKYQLFFHLKIYVTLYKKYHKISYHFKKNLFILFYIL